MVMRKSLMDMDCPYYKHSGTTSRFQVLEMDPGLLNQVQHRLARDDGNIGPGMAVWGIAVDSGMMGAPRRKEITAPGLLTHSEPNRKVTI